VQLDLSLALIMLERLPTPLALRDRDSRYVWVNQALCTALGRRRAELLGRTDFDLFSYELASLEHTRDERVFREGQRLLFEPEQESQSSAGSAAWHIPILGPNDVVRYVLRQWARPSVTFGELGSPSPLASEVQEHVRFLKEQQDQLLRKERLIVLGQLAGSLAHQIRNPLGAISNAVAVLRRQLVDRPTPSIQHALDIAQEEVWSANRIIGDLLAYSRIRPPVQSDVPVVDLIHEALSRETVPDGVLVDQRLASERVYVDAGQVGDAIANVIRNACEAMDGHGTLTIASRQEDEWVELTIADTGVGISQEEIALLFEPLVTSKALGMGLGLTTARALVINQGGTLECEGERDKGARFKLRLPARASARRRDGDENAAEASSSASTPDIASTGVGPGPTG
jgi:signal transduction histidine kinase